MKDKVIDYLIENSGCDLCGKCANYTPPKEGEDFTPCKAFEKGGNAACRKGMIEYFSGGQKPEYDEKKVCKSFSEALRQKRKEKGLTQKQLAKKLGTHYNVVGRWETGFYSPQLITLLCLSDFFNCSIDELVGR